MKQCKRNCYFCDECAYIGEGDYMCGVNGKIVIEDWQPTENFYSRYKGEENEV